MKESQSIPRTIDEYITGFPVDVRVKLEKLRATILRAAPGVEETIKYRMPAFMLHGDLVYFAACRKHIGFYLVPRGNAEFTDELSNYKGSKVTAQFPLEGPLPLDLVRRIVKFRVKENKKMAEMKKKG